MSKKALITGITGQDGSYLAELLLAKDYEVHGLARRTSTDNTNRIKHLLLNSDLYNKKLFIHHGDLSHSSILIDLFNKIKFDEVYHLAAQSEVPYSFSDPEYTIEITGLGTLRLLEAIRLCSPKSKFYQASSSEMFGLINESPQNESTPFHPRSPYGCAKVLSYWLAKNYREAYNIFTSNGICFNHESPRRGSEFVSKKIISGLVGISNKTQTKISLGNIYAQRDWGYAPEYVEGMWLMLQQEKPDDFILATNETHTVKKFIDEACFILNLEIDWRGQGLDEKCYLKNNNQVIIDIDKNYFRPSEVDYLIGDYNKAQKLLNWQPKVKFKDLIKIMIAAELKNSN